MTNSIYDFHHPSIVPSKQVNLSRHDQLGEDLSRAYFLITSVVYPFPLRVVPRARYSAIPRDVDVLALARFLLRWRYKYLFEDLVKYERMRVVDSLFVSVEIGI